MNKTEELRKKIAQIQCVGVDVGVGYGYWNCLNKDEKEEYLGEADQILQLLIEAKCVFVADDQTVGRLPKDGTPEAVLIETNEPYRVAQYGHLYCCKEMRSTGFLRTEPIVREE